MWELLEGLKDNPSALRLISSTDFWSAAMKLSKSWRPKGSKIACAAEHLNSSFQAALRLQLRYQI